MIALTEYPTAGSWIGSTTRDIGLRPEVRGVRTGG